MPHQPTVLGLSDVGRSRSRNEDSLSLLPELGVAVVADGMGGHPGGDVASRLAAEAAAEALSRELATGTGDGRARSEVMEAAMRHSVLAAHEAVRAEGEREPELRGMGTTITALAVDPESDTFVLGHVGDSRAYRYRHETLTQLTRDDTWVQERVDAEQLTLDQAKRHPFAHLLTQCVGLEDAPIPHVTIGSVQLGDVYLLCTDGLVGMLDDQELAQILAGAAGESGVGAAPDRGREILRALVRAANEAGGLDNITAVLVTIGAPAAG